MLWSVGGLHRLCCADTPRICHFFQQNLVLMKESVMLALCSRFAAVTRMECVVHRARSSFFVMLRAPLASKGLLQMLCNYLVCLAKMARDISAGRTRHAALLTIRKLAWQKQNPGFLASLVKSLSMPWSPFFWI